MLEMQTVVEEGTENKNSAVKTFKDWTELVILKKIFWYEPVVDAVLRYR